MTVTSQQVADDDRHASSLHDVHASSLHDVLDLVLGKGLVIDTYVRIPLSGLEAITDGGTATPRPWSHPRRPASESSQDDAG